MSTASPDNSALCPATAPMRGDSCDPAAGTCNYSTADCTCRMGFGGGGGGGFFGGAAADAGAAPSASTTETGTWNCQAPPRTGECPATLPTDGDTCDVPAQTPCDYDQDTCVCGGGGGFGGGGFGGGGGAVTWNCTGGQQAGGADGGTTPTQPAQTCPDAAPTDGDTCNVSGRLTCTYDTLDCRCPRAGGGGGGGFGGGGGGGTRAWTCNDNTMGPTQPGPAMDAGAAVTPMCPAEAPADGDTCDMPRGSDCAYADVQCSCNGFGGNRTWGCDPTATAMDASIAPPPPPPPADVDAGSADAAP
jgi:hypothetical protein